MTLYVVLDGTWKTCTRRIVKNLVLLAVKIIHNLIWSCIWVELHGLYQTRSQVEQQLEFNKYHHIYKQHNCILNTKESQQGSDAKTVYESMELRHEGDDFSNWTELNKDLLEQFKLCCWMCQCPLINPYTTHMSSLVIKKSLNRLRNKANSWKSTEKFWFSWKVSLHIQYKVKLIFEWIQEKSQCKASFPIIKHRYYTFGK